MWNDGYVPERFNAMKFLEFHFINTSRPTSYVENIPLSSCRKSKISLWWQILIMFRLGQKFQMLSTSQELQTSKPRNQQKTPWSRLLLEKLVRSQLDKSFAFYGNVSFIAQVQQHAIGLALNQTNTFDSVISFALRFIFMSFKKPKFH